MTRQRTPRATSLTIDEIVDKALTLIDEQGLDNFSMRRLGVALGVDPMAIYHHLANKQAVVTHVVERVLRAMPMLDATASWDQRVRNWAHSYRAVVTAHPELTYETIANPAAAGSAATSATAPLRNAVKLSGVGARTVGAYCDVIVDYVHGAALGAAAAARTGPFDDAPFRRTFNIGIDAIIDGIRARTRQG